MAHNLNYNTRTGQYSYMGRQAAWHNLGIVTGNYMSWQDILHAGFLDFTVEKRMLMDPTTGKSCDVWGMFRTDTQECLGGVGADYTAIQHHEGFQMIDHLVSSTDGAHYETAGVLGKGEVVWGLANLNRSFEVVPGDKHNNYLLFSTSHDGSRSHEYRLTDTRVVCQNTINIALSRGAQQALRVRHTKNAGDRLATLHTLIEDLNAQTEDVCAKMRELTTKRTTRETVEGIFDRLFPKTKRENGKEESSAVRTNMLHEILSRFESNDRNAFPEVRGTAYNLLNSITEYTDHFRSSRGGERASSAIFGSGDALKSRAFEVVYEVAGKDMPAAARPRTVFTPAPAPIVSRTTYAQMDATEAQPSLLDLILQEA